jgi:hypothetical protein
LELAQSTDQIIRKSNENLVDKLKTSFTLTSALITVVAALGYFIVKETAFDWIFLLIFLSLLCFVISLAITIRLFKPTTAFRYFDAMAVFNEYKEDNESLEFFLRKWACTISDNANHNATLLNSKDRELKLMYTFVVLGLAILSLSFLVLAINLI